MLFHRENRQYVQWSLDETAQMLVAQFPQSHVWIVKPNSMFLRTFSCYSHFVCSNDCGIPQHSVGQHSWQMLVLLFQKAVERMKQHLQNLFSNISNTEQNVTDKTNYQEEEKSSIIDYDTFNKSMDLPLIIVGFSKGCVVLNQLLYDLNEEVLSNDNVIKDFIARVLKMFWLDGGHSGRQETWVTSENVLQSLLNTNISVHVIVTPYQMKDDLRPWVECDKKKFVETLCKLGVKVAEKYLFADKMRTLDNHFSVIQHIHDKEETCSC